MKDNALYLEIDEDITSAIDKLSKSPAGPVQIVVPKRSTMLQSIINLKLLKKAAENNNKELVLVTSDRLSTDLAARVGLAVAPSLGAQAVLSEAKIPQALAASEEIIEADDPEPPPLDAEPVVPVPVKPKRGPLLKRRQVSDGPPVPPPAPLAIPDAPGADTDETPAASAGPKIPNFNRLRRRVMWVGLAALLVVGYLFTMYLITSATVTIYANGTKVDIDTSFAVDPNLKTTDVSKAVLAGQTITVNKDLSAPFTPTGKKDVGTKASGSLTFQNCEDSSVYPLSKGNTVTSQGLNFTTDDSIEIPAGTFTSGGTKCTSPTVSVSVTATQNGDTYNLTNASFTNPKLTANFKISGSLTGGTSKQVPVVAQSDVDTAKEALIAKDKENASRDLKGRIPSGYIELSPTESSSAGNITSAPAVGAEGGSATLSLKVTYTVLAVKESEYKELIKAQEMKQIGDKNQIYQDGLDKAQLTVTDKDSSGRQNFHLTTVAYGGAKLDTFALANQLKGQRYGDAANIASRLPGVTKAEISLKPGWATSMPQQPGKIKITIQVAEAK